MSSAYITGLGAFLPNEPVDNERVEAVLGLIHDQPSAAKDLILARNGIKSRYYAIDPETGDLTHSNTQMTAEAIRTLCRNTGIDIRTIECMACGTSSPEQLIPNHACMVHGELGSHPMEVAGLSGVCVSGMTAFKYSYLNVLSGLTERAVATGSELASVMLRGRHYEQQFDAIAHLDSEPYLSFGQDFLRWMLSDGAGAALIEPAPNPDRLCLRIEWLDILSLAHERETCMYFGGHKEEDGSLRSWRTTESFDELIQEGYFNLTQDAVALGKHMVAGFKESFTRTIERHNLQPNDIDYILPHLSSMFFKDKIAEALDEMDFSIPEERWFTNLATKGNTGSASIYIILDELVSSGRLEPGQTLLCGVPESARFSYAYMLLTVV